MAISFKSSDASEIYTEEYNKKGRAVYTDIGDYVDDTYKPKRKYRELVRYDDDGDIVYNVFQDNTPKDVRINYNKKFQAEQNMLRKMLKKQQEMIKHLESNLYATTGINKSSARDQRTLSEDEIALAGIISSGNSQALSIIKGMAEMKKIAAELNLKQLKNLEDAGESTDNMSAAQFGSNILSNIFNGGVPQEVPVDMSTIPDMDSGSINLDNISISERIKYEGKNIETVAILDTKSGISFLQALDNDNGGIKVDGYPIPNVGKLDVMPTDGKALDRFGNVYRLIIQ